MKLCDFFTLIEKIHYAKMDTVSKGLLCLVIKKPDGHDSLFENLYRSKR